MSTARNGERNLSVIFFGLIFCSWVFLLLLLRAEALAIFADDDE
jgi:hypothetical protein